MIPLPLLLSRPVWLPTCKSKSEGVSFSTSRAPPALSVMMEVHSNEAGQHDLQEGARQPSWRHAPYKSKGDAKPQHSPMQRDDFAQPSHPHVELVDNGSKTDGPVLPVEVGMVVTPEVVERLYHHIARCNDGLKALLEEKERLEEHLKRLTERSSDDERQLAIQLAECTRIKHECAQLKMSNQSIAQSAAAKEGALRQHINNLERVHCRLTMKVTEHARRELEHTKELAAVKDEMVALNVAHGREVQFLQQQLRDAQWQLQMEQNKRKHKDDDDDDEDGGQDQRISAQSASAQPREFCNIPTLLTVGMAMAEALVQSECSPMRKFVPNACLYTSTCPLLLKLERACQRCPTLQPKMIGFHCTKSPHCLASIMCNGFDPALRLNQVYGPGEYFSSNRTGAAQYDGIGDVTIVVVILENAGPSPAAERMHQRAQPSRGGRGGTTYYIVNNPPDNSWTYCLPIGLIAPPSFVPPRCPNHHSSPLSQSDETLLVELDGSFVPTLAPIGPQLRLMKDFVYQYGGHTYKVDSISREESSLLTARQTNLATGTVRQLKQCIPCGSST